MGVKCVLLILFCFFFLFNPHNFTSINPIHILFLISFLYFSFFKTEVLYVISSHNIITFCIFLFFLFFYFIGFLFFFSNDAVFSKGYVFFVSFIEVPICALFINVFLMNNNLFKLSIYRLMHYVLLLQFFFVLISFSFDDVRDWILLTSKIENFDEISNQFGLLRSFGLGSGLTYSMPMFVGLSCVLAANLFSYSQGIARKIYWALFFLAGCITVLLNAQIGMLPLLIYMIITGVSFLFSVNKLIKAFFIIPTIFVSFYYLSDFIMEQEYFKRSIMRFEDVSLLLNGHVAGVFLDLKEMHVFPKEQINILLGTGVDVFGVSSDVGYIRDLNMFGVLGFLVMVPVVLMIFHFAYINLKSRFGFISALSLLLSIPFFYMKGMLFVNNDVFNAAVLLAMNFFCIKRYRLNVCGFK